METILEQQRRYHEERDRLIKAMVDEQLVKKSSVKKKIRKRASGAQRIYVQIEYIQRLWLKVVKLDYWCYHYSLS